MADSNKIPIKEVKKEKMPEKITEKIEKKDRIEKIKEIPLAKSEQAPEVRREQIKQEAIKTIETEGKLSGIVAAAKDSQRQKEREKKIEKVLEKDLEHIYLSMLPEKRKEFKIAGEQTAREINKLLEKAKVKIKKIIGLIRKWLLMIPGVNKFFLEQEAKIKADEIMKIKDS